MSIIVAMHQDQGDREYQQDAMARKSFGAAGTLCVLADGMGGYEGGEIASKLIIEQFMSMFIDSDNIGDTLEKNLNLSNQLILEYKQAHEEVKHMGSTAIAFFITNRSFQWISVGDSPLYLIEDNAIRRINSNHSIAGLLNLQLEKGQITQEDLDANPNKHMLISAMTGDDIAEIDLSKEHALQEQNIFVLASDGIETLSESEIYNIVHKYVKHGNQKELNDAAKILVDSVLAKRKPNQDNVTVILISQQTDKTDIPKDELVSEVKNQIHNSTVKKSTGFNPKWSYMLIFLFLLIVFITWLIIDDNNSESVKGGKQIYTLNKDIFTPTDGKHSSQVLDKNDSNITRVIVKQTKRPVVNTPQKENIVIVTEDLDSNKTHSPVKSNIPLETDSNLSSQVLDKNDSNITREIVKQIKLPVVNTPQKENIVIVTEDLDSNKTLSPVESKIPLEVVDPIQSNDQNKS